MDFFEAQARARKRTGRLVFLFGLAVCGTVLAAYAAGVVIAAGAGNGEPKFFDPLLFAGTALGVLAVVGGASFFKWLQFSKGGSAVAEMVGGRRIDPGSADTGERRLLNIVEEMSIASGVPVPAVYVMDEEQGINAFAAGLTTGDAVVAVTRGTLQRLSRDELQGVIAHEFSHILNGDMRLNVRITAILFGILVLGLMGRGILEVMFRGRVRSSGGGKNKGGAVVVILFVGLSLLIIGYVGYFFGRLIQAAVSRQREYLADASAVQFTRNPGGITGALAKIGGLEEGSSLETSKAGQIGHFFFAQGFRSLFGGLFATHPRLEERIRAIDPRWNGAFPKLESDPEAGEAAASAFASAVPLAAPAVPGQARPSSPTPPQAPPLSSGNLMSQAGSVTETHFRQARDLLDRLPQTLLASARDAAGAQALAYALLLSAQDSGLAAVLDLIRTRAGTAMADRVLALQPLLNSTPQEARLPLVQLAIPALRTLTAAESDSFLAILEQATRADNRMSFFEFALERTMARALRLARKPSTRVDFDSFSGVSGDIARVLSALAWVGQAQAVTAAAAFGSGLAQLKLIETQIVLLQPSECRLTALAQSLDRLARASLPIKKRTLVAASFVIGHDGVVLREEAELFRAVAATLDCPMPVWETNQA
jgi:Zn-dependent protease with chaperone function